MIAILMSTYNGERYLREQIDSLLNQTYKDWKLYIRDDGSTDGTISIIESYMNDYPDLIILLKDDLGNLGSGRSFMRILSVVDADYYMFCDQDDVWLPNKVIDTINVMRPLDVEYENLPICVFTDLSMCDNKLNIIQDYLVRYLGREPDRINRNSFYRTFVFHSPVFGCTMMINQIAKTLSLPFDFVWHDTWISMICKRKGIMSYVDKSTILYRRTGVNVSGSKKKLIVKDYLLILVDFGRAKKMLSYNLKMIQLLNKLPFKVSYFKYFYWKIAKIFILFYKSILK